MDAIRKIERFDWDDFGMVVCTDGDYMRAEEVLRTLASKKAELVRLREALAELLAADDAQFPGAPFPNLEAGMAAQNAWAVRRYNAKVAARALIQPTE